MPAPLAFLVYALAIARITRLLVADEILEAPRDRLRGALLRSNHGKLWYLTTCQWCMSIWVAAFTVPVIYAYGQTAWVQLPALVLAYSEVTGLLADAKGD